jgi:DNA-binding NarL/FixJ family response regulator
MERHPTNYKVLIVDDSSAVREALRWAMEDSSDMAVVGEAEDGEEAMNQADALSPDVVILDIELPKMDGYAVARSLKSREDAPVVIFLSVHGDSLSRQRGAEAGGDGFAEKGTGWQSLLTQVRQSLESRHKE